VIDSVEQGLPLHAFQDEKLMFIDDLGAERKEIQEYGNVLTPMVDLLEHRYSRRLFTVVTTNLDASQLGEKYGARLRDRFREMFIVVPFSNKSFR
jgi:DNA replication protein DnaC